MIKIFQSTLIAEKSESMTLKEIAKIAGVSVSTVSRVVNQNNPKAASPEIQQKIWNVVRETGYIPNTAARQLKSGHTEEDKSTPKSIACIFGRSKDTLSDPFFSQLARSIEQEAFKNNFLLKYSFSAMDMSRTYLDKHLSELRVDGIVVLGRHSDDLLDYLGGRYANLVYTGLNPVGAAYDQVVCDGYEAAFAAVKYLHKLGHINIGYIGEQNKENRFLAYQDALKQLGLPFSNSFVANVTQSSEGGYTGALELLGQAAGLTAIFCANDVTAIGAMRAFKENGLRIPKDISIIGIDDIETAQYMSPMLTTIHIPLEELGKIAAQTLINRIQRKHKLPMKISLPFYIAKRESCAPKRSFERNVSSL